MLYSGKLKAFLCASHTLRVKKLTVFSIRVGVLVEQPVQAFHRPVQRSQMRRALPLPLRHLLVGPLKQQNDGEITTIVDKVSLT